MGGHRRKPRTLSEKQVEQFLADARLMLRANNRLELRADGDHFRAIADLNAALFKAATIIAGTDRPWPVSSTVGPC